VKHHVALSVVGTGASSCERLLPREDGPGKLIEASQIPYTIVRSTQFFEFARGLAQSAADGQRFGCRPFSCSPSSLMMSLPRWRMWPLASRRTADRIAGPEQIGRMNLSEI